MAQFPLNVQYKNKTLFAPSKSFAECLRHHSQESAGAGPLLNAKSFPSVMVFFVQSLLCRVRAVYIPMFHNIEHTSFPEVPLRVEAVVKIDEG